MKPAIAFFGSSLVSAHRNGAALHYRGVIRALAERGFAVTFYEPDADDRQQQRDIRDPDWARVAAYAADEAGVSAALQQAQSADVIVKTSGTGVFDELLNQAVLDIRRPEATVIFWDVDAPATLDRLERNPADPFNALIRQFDLVFTYGGGTRVVDAYRSSGARECVAVYDAVDPSIHFPVAADLRFAGDLGFLDNRLPDRQAQVEEFFLTAADRSPSSTFVLGGSGWDDEAMPANVRYVGQVFEFDHNAFNCTPRAVLNVSRISTAKFGFSPGTRVFEAAAAGACLVTDEWDDIEMFLEPGREVLVARDGAEVAAHLDRLTLGRAIEIGCAAQRCVLAHHTYAHRAAQVDALLDRRVVA
jgi:spore maturation protein CgeB